MPTVTGPDGSTFNFPDSTPPAEMQAALAQHYGPAAARGAPAAPSASQPTGGLDQASAAVRAASHQVPLLGDAAMTLGAMGSDLLHGHPQGWGGANDQVHQLLAQDQQKYPLTTALSGVAGGVGSALAGGMALKAAGFAPAALELRSGQTLANAARLAAGGALAGGAQGAAQGGGERLAAGDLPGAVPAAGAGALGGAVSGAVLGPVAGGVTAVAGRVFAPLPGKVALALSKMLGENAADIQDAWSNAAQVAGRPLTMPEFASLHQQGLIKGAASNSEPITTALTQAAEDAGRARSDTMQATLAPPPSAPLPTAPLAPPTQAGASSAQIANAKTAQGDLDYAAVRQHSFAVPGAETFGEDDTTPFALASKALADSSVSPLARQTISRELQDGALSGNSVDALRRNLTKRHDANPGDGYGDLRDNFLDTLASHPANAEAGATLRQANATYAANAQREAGAAQGESILGTQTPDNFAATAASKPNANPNFPLGLQSGASSKLASAAATPSGAVAEADRFANDGNLHAKLTTVFGSAAADGYRQLGEVESHAAAALAPYAKALPPIDTTSDDAVKNVLQASAAMAFHNPVIKANYLARVLSNVRMSPAVQTKVGEYLGSADPVTVEQGIRLLHRAGVDSAALRQRVMSAALATAGMAGVAAGDAAVQITDVHPATAAELAGATAQ